MLALASLSWEGIHRPWLWLALLTLVACAVVSVYRRFPKEAGAFKSTWLVGLRSVGLLALLAMLAKPAWKVVSESVEPSRLLVIVDDSRSMAMPTQSGKTRFELAQSALSSIDTWAKSRPATLAVDWFDIQGRNLSRESFDKCKIDKTDIVRAVSRTVAQRRGAPLAGALVISDGADNSGRQDLLELVDLATPIHSLVFPYEPNDNPVDFEIRGVKAPPRTLVHNQTKVEVSLARLAGNVADVDVTLRRGTTELARQTVHFAEGARELLVTVPFTPTEAGDFVLTAGVIAASGEKRIANNVKHFSLHVDGDAIRVIYADGYLRHEFKFLKTCLEDDPDLRLVTVVRRGNPNAGIDRPPVFTAETLKNVDVIILGDIDQNFCSESEFTAVAKWVEQGHGLLLLGGYQSFGADGLRKTALADVAPVVFAAGDPFQSEEPTGLQLTEAGRRHPAFDLTGDSSRDRATWQSAPPLAGVCLIDRVKAGAETLAVSPSVQVNGAPAVLAATQRYGGGQVLTLLFDTTWRWRRAALLAGQPDSLHSRFWGQTVRWLSGRSLQQQRPPLVVTTDRPVYDVGKPVNISVVRTNTTVEPVTQVDVITEAGEVRGVEIKPDAGRPEVATGVFVPAVAGRYEVQARGQGEKNVVSQRAEFLVQGADLELADTSLNRGLLEQLSSRTGGMAAEIQEVESLLKNLPTPTRRTARITETPLWNSPALFVVFVLTLSTEWILRRRWRMV